MKAVILEKRDGYSAVLREDGVIEKLKIRGEVGDTIYVDPVRRRKAGIYRFAGIAAAALIFLTAGLSARYYVFTPSSYVTMDVNPSVEFSMNRLDRVIDAEAVNEDAEEIVSALKEGRIWGCSLEKVIEQTTELLKEKEYLDGTDNAVLFAVAAEDDRSYETIEANVREAESLHTDFTMEIMRGERKDYDTAHEMQLSLGRYLKMIENEDSIAEEYRQKPVSDMLGNENPDISSEIEPDTGAAEDAGIMPEGEGEMMPEAPKNNMEESIGLQDPVKESEEGKPTEFQPGIGSEDITTGQESSQNSDTGTGPEEQAAEDEKIEEVLPEAENGFGTEGGPGTGTGNGTGLEPGSGEVRNGAGLENGFNAGSLNNGAVR